MSERNEVIVTSDCSDLSACVWDSHSGTTLMSYKGGGTTNSHCLSIVGNDYVMSAEKKKPIIYMWALNSREITRDIDRIVVPGSVSALSVSPNFDYCVIGAQEKLYVWDLGSGQLISTTTRHFRPVSCIKFTDEGSYFVSAGQDGMVIVWPLAHIVSHHASEFLQQVDVSQSEPKYVFSDHSLPVTDLYVGHGGIQALVVSVSGDHTCKIYNLADGSVLISLVLNSGLSAVTMNDIETELFIGTCGGSIYQFNLEHMPRSLDYHLTSDDLKLEYKGHSKAITCLSVSLDGLRFLSGSVDAKVIVWDIKSRLSVKVLYLKGKVNNAFFSICPKSVFSRSFQPSVVIQNFKKNNLGVANDRIIFFRNEGYEQKHEVSSVSANVVQEHLTKPQATLEAEIVKMKQINNKLYSFSVNKVFDNITQ